MNADRHPDEGEITCPRCDGEPYRQSRCTRCDGAGIVSIASLKARKTQTVYAIEAAPLSLTEAR